MVFSVVLALVRDSLPSPPLSHLKCGGHLQTNTWPSNDISSMQNVFSPAVIFNNPHHRHHNRSAAHSWCSPLSRQTLQSVSESKTMQRAKQSNSIWLAKKYYIVSTKDCQNMRLQYPALREFPIKRFKQHPQGNVSERLHHFTNKNVSCMFIWIDRFLERLE
jgi:hypothetical protein